MELRLLPDPVLRETCTPVTVFDAALEDVVAEMLAAIHHDPTGQRLAAERAFLAALDGSCETPIGGLADLDGGNLRLRGEILRVDGSEVLADDMTGAVEDGADMGREMAVKLLKLAGPGFLHG